jgi:catechol 2,3-dioxygenase
MRRPANAGADAAMSAGGVISPEAGVGAVTLSVDDLDRSVGYYTEAIGLAPIGRDVDRAELGAGGRTLLRLVERPGARVAPGSTGLYHFALLVPSRVDLARVLAHLVGDRVPLTGAADHLVSEALYLSDPDGHGIEIYRDRPRAEWVHRADGGLEVATLPLDARGLIGELEDSNWEGLSAGTRMGHVHLRVADIADAVRFYAHVLGVPERARMPGAAFFGAGGYHHHLGANVWESRGGSPAPEGALGLIETELRVPDEAARGEVLGRLDAAGVPIGGEDGRPVVRDPSGIAHALVVGPAGG